MEATTEWVPDHFIGGHPALDLANTVYDRRSPAVDNDLFGSVGDLANWLHASGLAGKAQADELLDIADADLLDRVREVREATFLIFDAIAAGRPAPASALGSLFLRAADGLCAEPSGRIDPRPELAPARWRDPDAVTGFLAMLSIEAFYTLPRERVRLCPRCGWVFVDASRGGKRRWCSMQTCGNREKASRHRALRT